MVAWARWKSQTNFFIDSYADIRTYFLVRNTSVRMAYYSFVHKSQASMISAKAWPAAYKINSDSAFSRFIFHTFASHYSTFAVRHIHHTLFYNSCTTTDAYALKFPHESHFRSSTSIFIDIYIYVRWMRYVWFCSWKASFMCRQTHWIYNVRARKQWIVFVNNDQNNKTIKSIQLNPNTTPMNLN